MDSLENIPSPQSQYAQQCAELAEAPTTRDLCHWRANANLVAYEIEVGFRDEPGFTFNRETRF